MACVDPVSERSMNRNLVVNSFRSVLMRLL